MRRFLKRRLDDITNRLFYRRHKDALRMDYSTYQRLSAFSKSDRVETNIKWNGHDFSFSAPFWFLHSIEEIFVEEVYKFESTRNPLTIIDCGANIGLSVLYFKINHPSARLIAFEADPQIFNVLKTNVGKYSFDDVDLRNAAIWNENTTLRFSSEGSVGGKIDLDSNQAANMVEVPAVRLRDILEAQQVDFLKIDIEGAEFEVLKDCKDLLYNVGNLFIEYHTMPEAPQHLHTILQWVNEAGFNYYIREAWNNMSFPFLNQMNDFYQMQLNIFCFRKPDAEKAALQND
jgi:FkbM family methyltransferase